jgi:hypothetical protein
VQGMDPVSFLERHPEIWAMLCDMAADVYAEIDHDPSPVDISVVVVAIMSDLIAMQQALIDEQFDDEGIERIIDEEIDRHADPDTRAARVEDVEKALHARMIRTMRKAYPHWFGDRD